MIFLCSREWWQPGCKFEYILAERMLNDISLQQGVMATRMQNASTTICYRTTTRHDRRKINIVFKRMWQIEDLFHEWAARKLLLGISTLFEYDIQFDDNESFCVVVYRGESTLSVSFTLLIWFGLDAHCNLYSTDSMLLVSYSGELLFDDMEDRLF